LGESPSYTLIIPEVLPSQVDLEEPSDALFPLLSRYQRQTRMDGKPAVIISLSFRAVEAGRAAPGPITVTVGGLRRRAVFEPVIIQVDPMPEITLEFEGPRIFREGEGAFFSVTLKNAAEILSLDWSLRPDSLLRQTGRRGDSFRFQWIPLASGAIELPAFTAEAVAPSGERKSVKLSGIVLDVLAREAQNVVESPSPGSGSSAGDSFIRNAFSLGL
jgi:hypothetical protein